MALPVNPPEHDRNRGYDAAALEHYQQELRDSARTTLAVIADLEREARNAADRRVEVMQLMANAHMSWAEIGRIWGVSPQAAMYATGHATRTRGKEPPVTKATVKKDAAEPATATTTASTRKAATRAQTATGKAMARKTVAKKTAAKKLA